MGKNRLHTKRKLVCGVGVNDADYSVRPLSGEPGRLFCPYYAKWAGMLKRCYCEKHLRKQPTYVGCYVMEEWTYFSNFKRWMETQPYALDENFHLDKDLLIRGNKVYSEDTCVFIPKELNTMLSIPKGSDVGYMVGVHQHATAPKFQAITRGKYLGLFTNENRCP